MRNLNRTLTVSAIAAALVLASCGGSGSASDETSTTLPETSTTEAAKQLAPLTGLPISDPAILTRPALVAKIDNHPAARPQSGLNAADIVFEENVEKLTRYAAVFHSTNSDPVGPLRSGRTQDIDLLGAFNKPLFVWSGGNGRVTRAINSSDLVNLGPTPAKKYKVYYREKSRKAPHNLYTRTSEIWKLAPAGSAAPSPQFTYRAAGASMPATATAVRGGKVTMDSVLSYWEWDAAKGVFLRSIRNYNNKKLEVHMDTVGGQVNTNNVVVLTVTYKASKADRSSPEAQTVGSGDVVVMTNGMTISGTWTRASRTEPFTLKDTAGAVIELTPGRTFVHLVRKNNFAPVAVGVDPNTVKWAGK